GTAGGTVVLTNFAAGKEPFFYELGTNLVEEVGGRVLFLTVQIVEGQQRWRIWAADGNTVQVVVDNCSSCGDLHGFGNRVAFFRRHEGNRDLVATDGTAAGMRTLLHVCQEPCLSVSVSLMFEPGLFVIENAEERSVWLTDGTAEGTRKFASLPDGVVVDDYRSVLAGGRLYAAAYENEGWEKLKAKLMVTDGGDWQLLAEVPSRAPSSNPRHLLAVGDRLQLVADTAPVPQLLSSTGTATGTEQVTALTAPSDSYARDAVGPVELTKLGDKVLFAIREEWEDARLWTSDGTAAGTFPLAASNRVEPGLTTLGGELYFVRSGPGFDEVWRTDGTDAGTVHRFVLPSDISQDRHLTALGDELWFVDDYIGRELWRSSPSGAGMTKVATFDEGYAFEPAPFFTKLGATVFFAAADEDGGREVWRTAGTPATTTRLIDARPGETGSRPADLLVFDGALYFFADSSEDERALFRSDGTSAGTVALRQFRRPLEEAPRAELLALDGRLYFVADDGVHGRELWSSDGTAAGTRQVVDLFPGFAASSPAWLTAVGGRLYFAAHDGVHGRELWSSDGTEAGTTLVHDLAPGASSSRPEELELQGSRLYFAADDGLTGRELWMLDFAQATGVCVPTDTALCLGGRFRVEATWKDFAGNRGAGHTVPLTADTGGFWFFGAENVEVVLKVLDGHGVNGHHWVFYGALSSVEYALTVTDVETGLTVRYRNPSGRLASVADTTGFGPSGAFALREHVGGAAGTPARRSSSRDALAAKSGVCVPSATRLSLRDGRFAVEA
ncbi:MAG TPA: ELWxxDGT repeat protein, partial [Thermoanaerobaculia bacterium]|nr:ELWxxDGT repeat protein [Thermoanaerobaculia bacterium]